MNIKIMDYEHEDSQQISKYNDAGYSISRLNDSWIACRMFIRRSNLNAWKTELDSIWMELYPDVLRQQNKADIIKQNKVHMHQIAKAKIKKSRQRMFFVLMERQCFLREVQDLAGKAGVYRDENEEGFE